MRRAGYALTDRELAIVLAALRHYQESVPTTARDDVEFFGDGRGPTDAQIERLRERLSGNYGGTA